MKLLKTSDELISHMKIKFDIVKEEDAKIFLQNIIIIWSWLPIGQIMTNVKVMESI